MITIDYRLGLKGVRGVTQTEFAGLLDKAIRMAVADLFSATEYLVKNGKSMGIDPDNIVVTGSSAGAITVQQAEWVLCNRAASGRPGRALSSGLCNYDHVADGLPKDSNYKGVMAFALLGFCNYYNIPSNLPSCRGASRRVVLGKVTNCF